MKTDIDNKGFAALLLTEFLGAFNDNAFKLVIAFLAVDQFVTRSGGSFYLSLAGILFALPYFLFSTYAGFLADRFSKQKIIVFIKFIEILLMVMGLFALMSANIWFTFLVLFLMGTHSAFFSPSKYGILPEILPSDRLSWGNGLVQMWTFTAIILGQACGGILTQMSHMQVYKTAYAFIGIAVVGALVSLFVTKVRPSGATRRFELNFLKEAIENIKWIKPNRGVFLSILGLMYFGFLGGLFHLNILLYARKIMGIEHFPLSILLIILAFGIGLGSLLAGKLSNKRIEFGFVPLGAIGLSLFSIILGFVYHSYLKVAVCLFLLGLSAGFYIIPLNAYIQQASPVDRKGQVLATTNILTCLTGLFASAMIFVFKDIIQLNSAQIFLLMGLLTSLGAIYVCRLLPEALARLVVLALTHSLYKIRIVDRENIPMEGGALLVSNHVAMVDALLILASTHRPIRFIVNSSIYRSRFWALLLKLGRAIPISRADKPREILESLNEAKEAIRSGELVCIFAEGQLTRTGNILKFNKGMERIMREVDRPIIPVHLDRIWGSIFSYEGDKYYFKIPKILPYPVTVSFGKPLPSTATAFEVRQQVMELGAEAFQYRLADKMTLPEAFYKEARKHPFKFCVADSSGRKLNYAMTLVSAVALTNQLKRKLKDEMNVGIMLPPSVAGVLANIAVSFLNKVPINLNHTTSKESLDSIFRQTQMKVVIASKVFLEKAKIELPTEPVFIEEISTALSAFDKLKAFIQSFIVPIFLANRIIFKKSQGRSLEDLATIMFTSGSTGEPKGVMLTHFNIISNLEGLYQVFHMKDDEIFMGVLPFFHSFGFTATLWLPLISGTSAVYHYNPLDAKMVGKLVNQHKVTVLKATPTFLNAYLHRCEPEEFKSLRLIVVGAEKLKDATAQAFKEKFNLEPMEGYGCTELSPVVSLNLPDFTGAGDRQKARKPGSIGMPLPGIAVRIVDPDTMRPLGEGERGLLLVKGPNIMKGYLDNPEKTAQVIQNGWYITGDIAQIDEDGFITITDRLSRFSKIGGEMVPHIKIEEAIHSLLGSSEQICVVTSVPDEKKGERLAVLYVGEMDAAAIVETLKKNGLPNLWIPDAEMFYRIDAIPLLGSGKLDLGALKRRATEVFAKKESLP